MILRLLRKRSWPGGGIDLLLKAALAPEEEARAAWRRWTASRDFDEIVWSEMRLLAPLALRLPQLDPDSPLRPRIDGLAKHLWTKTQLGLRAASSAFDEFDRAGVPFIVFKGAAQHAEGLASGGRRIMGDVDILVRPEDALRALAVLDADGWASVNGESFEYLSRVAGVRLSANFRKGHDGEIDLHTDAFHFTRIDPELSEDLWARRVPARLATKIVHVPDPANALLLQLAHAATSDSGDWALDVAARIERQAIDWDRLAELAARRGLVPASYAGLSYLSEELSIPIPKAVLDELSSSAVSVGETLKYWSNVRDRTERNLIEKVGNRLADRLLRGDGYSVIVKDRRAIAVTRPNPPLRWLLGLGRAVPSIPGEPGLAHRIVVETPRYRSRVVLRVSFPRPRVSRRVFFDMTANSVAIARLRSRAGRPGATGEDTRTFAVRVPGGMKGRITLEISARPAQHVPLGASADEIEALAPIPFRVIGAWVV